MEIEVIDVFSIKGSSILTLKFPKDVAPSLNGELSIRGEKYNIFGVVFSAHQGDTWDCKIMNKPIGVKKGDIVYYQRKSGTDPQD